MTHKQKMTAKRVLRQSRQSDYVHSFLRVSKGGVVKERGNLITLVRHKKARHWRRLRA